MAAKSEDTTSSFFACALVGLVSGISGIIPGALVGALLGNTKKDVYQMALIGAMFCSPGCNGNKAKAADTLAFNTKIEQKFNQQAATAVPLLSRTLVLPAADFNLK